MPLNTRCAVRAFVLASLTFGAFTIVLAQGPSQGPADGHAASSGDRSTEPGHETPSRSASDDDLDNGRVDIFGGYSYQKITSFGAPYDSNHGLGAAAFYNLNRTFALGGEYHAVFNHGSLPVTGFPNFDSDTWRHFYVFGPRISIRPSRRVTVFGQALAGGFTEKTKYTFTNVSHSSETGAAVAVGGGLDIHLNKRFAIRPAQLEFLTFDYSGASDWSRSVIFSTGFVVKFGSR